MTSADLFARAFYLSKIMHTRQTMKFSDEEDDNGEAYRLHTEVSLGDLSDDEALGQQFEVLKLGKVSDWRWPDFEITIKLLKELKQNFENNVVELQIALDVDHRPANGAMAWIESLEVKNGKLLARFKDWTEEGQAALLQKKFKYFSVEFSPHQKVQKDGKKLVTPNVLKGIALTNRPVIKGMKPTLLSEEEKAAEQSKAPQKQDDTMKIVKMFGEDLLKTKKVTEADHNRFKSMFKTLSEEEKNSEEMKTLSANVEAEAKTTAEAETTAAKELSDAKAAKAAEDGKNKTIEEQSKALSTLGKTVEGLEERENGRALSENMKSIMLSESNKTGFKDDDKEAVETFMKKLSEDDAKEFCVLVKKIQSASVHLGEVGHGKNGKMDGKGKNEQGADAAQATALSEANTEAEKRFSAEGNTKPLHEHIEDVMKEKEIV